MATSNVQMRPYDHEVYHAKTGSVVANYNLLVERGGMDAINTKIRDCFLKHNVYTYLSAAIVHRHFDLTPDERNVEDVHGNATASSEDVKDLPAVSWLFADGYCYPYEFRRKPLDIEIPEAFLAEFLDILVAYKIDGLLGFQYLEDDMLGYETTDYEKRISTTVSLPASTQMPPNAGPASFAFSPVPASS